MGCLPKIVGIKSMYICLTDIEESLRITTAMTAICKFKYCLTFYIK